jgi:uncharacterized cysteine cluster protein YcgN (CxxCxxCC family)
VVIYHLGPHKREGQLGNEEQPFWRLKTLGQMSGEEWESLCDGCGRCCLIKLEDEDSGEVHLTRLACKLLDTGSCRCTDYPGRHSKVADCISIDAKKIKTLKWLPATCAYRRLAEGQELAWWHPLVSGSAETVHQAGISVRGWARSETGVRVHSYPRYIIKGVEEGRGGTMMLVCLRPDPDFWRGRLPISQLLDDRDRVRQTRRARCGGQAPAAEGFRPSQSVGAKAMSGAGWPELGH